MKNCITCQKGFIPRPKNESRQKCCGNLKCYSRFYYLKNCEKILRQSLYRLKSEDQKDRIREYRRQRYRNNINVRMYYSKQGREWRDNNLGRWREYKRNYDRIRRSSNPQERIRVNVSNLINYQLRQRLLGKGARSILDILSYSLGELMIHLERQFKEGMSWDNYGKWHIDHIRPNNSFTYKSIDDPAFRECWALNNLQPLWASENISKGAKIYV